MNFILILTFYTLLYFFLSWKVWKQTKEYVLQFGLFFLFYWTLLGAWVFTIDALTGFNGAKIGLSYYYISEKLFPFKLDHNYLLAINYLGLFLLLIPSFLLVFMKRSNKSLKKLQTEIKGQIKTVYINHYILILIGLISIIFSFFLIYKEIFLAINKGLSIYTITRSLPNKWYTLHQLLNQVSVVSLYIGLTILLSQKTGKFIKGNDHLIIKWLYLISFVIIVFYLMILGNRRELLFAGILSISLFWLNNNKKIHFPNLSILFIAFFVPMFLNHYFRRMATPMLLNIVRFFGVSFDHTVIILPMDDVQLGGMFSSLFLSNEMFFAHFSMYGILLFNLPFSYGGSFVNLISSIIPRAIYPYRPETAYDLYVSGVHAVGGQGYTINHAAAWYINFGVLGIIIGALILGYLMFYLLKKQNKIGYFKSDFKNLFFLLAFTSLIAFIPSIIRSGPEVYKSVLFEALLLPCCTIFLATLSYKKIKHIFKSKG